MLGDVVYEGKGKTIGMRVLKNGKMEYTMTMPCLVYGEETLATWTSESEPRPDGTSFMEFWGSFVTKGGNMGKYAGTGNFINHPDGSSVGRGCVCYSNPPGKFAKLNGIAVVWEFQMDKDGNFHNKGWEWK